ncbi:pentapeptide repeat-containing protein, partial [Planctomycetota bacterium]
MIDDDNVRIGASKIDEAQYALLKKCIDAGDAAEWNQWREQNPDAVIWLQGAVLAKDGEEQKMLRGVNLQGANMARSKLPGIVLVKANLRGAELLGADLNGAVLANADLRDSNLHAANLNDVNLTGADMRNTNFRFVKANSNTLINTSFVNRGTDFTGVALGGTRVEPGLRQLLEYNIRRNSWGEWYSRHPVLSLPTRLFWLMCDYGNSTWRVVISFVVSVFFFAAAYTLIPESIVVNEATFPEPHLNFLQAFYFSIVTMTTLGFGDVCANPESIIGQLLLSIHVIVG